MKQFEVEKEGRQRPPATLERALTRMAGLLVMPKWTYGLIQWLHVCEGGVAFLPTDVALLGLRGVGRGRGGKGRTCESCETLVLTCEKPTLLSGQQDIATELAKPR